MMWQEDRAARLRKKQQKSFAGRVGLITGLPMIVLFVVNYQSDVMRWLRSNGVLPDYGVAQFFQRTNVVDYDAVFVSAIAGALLVTPGYLIALPIARLLIR